ncbi:MAG: hypothetical protein ACK5MY_02435 [Jhaorihella sp.]
MPIRQTCLPIKHKTPKVPVPLDVTCGCDWPVEQYPEPLVEGCECGCPRDPDTFFGPSWDGQISHDFIVKRPVTLVAVGMPCDAFATVEQGFAVCDGYVYDDWFSCGKPVKISRENNNVTITSPGRYRLKLFYANPHKIYIRKVKG